MKRAGVLILVFLIALSTIVIAQNGTLEDTARECFEDKLGDNCADSSNIEQLTFSILAGGNSDCNSNLDDLKDDDEDCWPDGSCEIKETALATLALGSGGGAEWLLNNNKTMTELDWYLQVDAESAATCSIDYDSSSRTIVIDEDKTITASGSLVCFDIVDQEGNTVDEGYWLKISDSCLDNNFTISCNQDFISTIMYKKPGDEIWHISSQTESASANDETKHKIDFFCISESVAIGCDYEDNLWAALALQEQGEDIDKILPYIIAFAEDEDEDFPEAFLNLFGKDYVQEITDKQDEDHWDVSGKRFYDTALAIRALGGIPEATEDWLEDEQSDDGCWGNVRDTAILLWAAWGEDVSTGGGGGGLTCENQNGAVCDELTEECTGISRIISGERCCIGGDGCQISAEESECERNNYDCRFSCFSDEETVSLECPEEKECCKEEAEPTPTPTPTPTPDRKIWPIVLLVIFIVLVIVGIIFRNKVKIFLSRFRKKGPATAPGKRPPYFPPRAGPRAMQPRPTFRPGVQPMKRPPTKTEKEFQETMKKLREIGK